MRIWLACFLLLFAIAELLEWVQHLSLPLPIYILGGTFLAIASNSNKRLGLFFGNSPIEPPSAIEDSDYPTNCTKLSQSQSKAVSP
ncbi:hypothetical protein [Chroococcidiopsis sp. CCMEE 29]|uniref:hypothetical protein n=1 Tax=Chroococcidiopsis sp. CCMEE 29 TaxID=155894 RepID=UPI002020B0E6|nr:hypothetical protein [Chroococcidiopsis sp. CCMEE 29]